MDKKSKNRNSTSKRNNQKSRAEESRKEKLLKKEKQEIQPNKKPAKSFVFANLLKKFCKILFAVAVVAVFVRYVIYWKANSGVEVSECLFKASHQLQHFEKMKEEFMTNHFQKEPLDKFFEDHLIPIQHRIGSIRNQIYQKAAWIQSHKQSGSLSEFGSKISLELIDLLERILDINHQIEPILAERKRISQKYITYSKFGENLGYEFEKISMSPKLAKEGIVFKAFTPKALSAEKMIKDEKDLEKIMSIIKEIKLAVVSLAQAYAEKEQLEDEIITTILENRRPEGLYFIFYKIWATLFKISTFGGPGRDLLWIEVQKSSTQNEANLGQKHSKLVAQLAAKVDSERTKLELFDSISDRWAELMLELYEEVRQKFQNEYFYHNLKLELQEEIEVLVKRLEELQRNVV